MWYETFTDKKGKTKYCFYERYIDPLTNKRKRTSIVMNKSTRQSQKEAQRQLNEKIDQLIHNNINYVSGIEKLTFIELVDVWFDIYKVQSVSKRSTFNAKASKINTLKSRIPNDFSANLLNMNVL